MSNIIYLNGKYLSQADAKISVMDRGFLFGDGVYEVIPVFNGRCFGFDEHMTRLCNSLREIEIQNPHTKAEWKKILETLLEKNNKTTGNHSFYCQITRGADVMRSHTFSTDLKSTVVAFIMPFKTIPLTELEKGFAAITANDTRRQKCFVKAVSLLPNILHLHHAKKAGAIEAILIRDNEVLECTSSNIFIVKNNVLMTPPLSQRILSGITRQKIIALAKSNQIDCQEITITPAMLKEADEIWVTGSLKEICPIVTLDGKPVCNGKVGPLWYHMHELYEAMKLKV